MIYIAGIQKNHIFVHTYEFRVLIKNKNRFLTKDLYTSSFLQGSYPLALTQMTSSGVIIC
jgi:hypothetical protein